MNLSLKIFSLLFLVLFFACGKAEPRMPISIHSSKKIKLSIQRNKQLLDNEVNLIKQAIALDSMRNYNDSSQGFWYAYLEKNSEGISVAPGDEVSLSYDIKTLGINHIYTESEIGLIKYVVDKQDVMFSGIRNALKLMKQGERLRVFFPSSLAYSYAGDGNRIGVNVPICCDVKLIEIHKNK